MFTIGKGIIYILLPHYASILIAVLLQYNNDLAFTKSCSCI